RRQPAELPLDHGPAAAVGPSCAAVARGDGRGDADRMAVGAQRGGGVDGAGGGGGLVGVGPLTRRGCRAGPAVRMTPTRSEGGSHSLIATRATHSYPHPGHRPRLRLRLPVVPDRQTPSRRRARAPGAAAAARHAARALALAAAAARHTV